MTLAVASVLLALLNLTSAAHIAERCRAGCSSLSRLSSHGAGTT
jgi:hypothetical protein